MYKARKPLISDSGAEHQPYHTIYEARVDVLVKKKKIINHKHCHPHPPTRQPVLKLSFISFRGCLKFMVNILMVAMVSLPLDLVCLSGRSRPVNLSTIAFGAVLLYAGRRRLFCAL